MCGILGIIKLDKGKYPFEPSGKFLYNRGPDGASVYRDEKVTLYHSRLAVIDRKETSNQPIINGDKLILICNGEVYNHQDIKKLGNYTYVSTSDCEAILHVYVLHGKDGFKLLDGTFSFILYDKDEKKVIIHRDNIGKKPLYMLQDNNLVIVSSSVLAIADNHSKPLHIQRDQVPFYLEYGHINPQHSFFKEIKPIFPGEIYEVDIGTKKITRTVLEKGCVKKYEEGIDDNIIQRDVEKSIRNAVRKRMEGVEKPALLFSGGIDSTVLAQCMLQQGGKNVKLISVKQPLRLLHDEPYIRQAAKTLKHDIIFVNIGKVLYARLNKFIANLDQPFAIYSYYFLAALTLKAREYGNVLFTGDGGDEVFLGYGKIGDWFAEDTAVVPDFMVGPQPIVPMSNYAMNEITIGLLGHGFVKVDKATAENGVESRAPFLDWEVMCVARGISREYWMKHGITKYPLRKMLTDGGFSHSFVYRKKIGFSYPFRYLMMPRYGLIKSYIDTHKNLLEKYLGIKAVAPSFWELYKRFDWHWRLYVLLKYMERNLKYIAG